MRKFDIRPAVYFGTGSLKMLHELTYSRVLVITDPFMEKSGGIKPVLNELNKDAEVTIFSEIHPDPDTVLVAAGMEVFLKVNPDLIIACGGGSTIDAAKSIIYCSKKVERENQRRIFVAVPTTSGTGSEVTSFSVITVDNRKIPVVDDEMLPDYAVLDATLTLTVPPSVTADTGMDVLTHAIEAYVSTDAGSFSDALAEKAVELVYEYLPAVVRNGEDRYARERMHEASCMAGMAFTNASLGINHSLAHAVGGALHLPHGRTNAILLPWVIGYNAEDERARKRYGILAKKLGITCKKEDGAEALIASVRALMGLIRIPASFEAAGIEKEAFDSNLDNMANAALQDNCTDTNPRKPTLEDLKSLYRVCFKGGR